MATVNSSFVNIFTVSSVCPASVFLYILSGKSSSRCAFIRCFLFPSRQSISVISVISGKVLLFNFGDFGQFLADPSDSCLFALIRGQILFAFDLRSSALICVICAICGESFSDSCWFALIRG